MAVKIDDGKVLKQILEALNKLVEIEKQKAEHQLGRGINLTKKEG